MTLGHHVYSMPPWFCFPVITPSATPHPPPRQRRHRSERTLASVRRLRPGDHVLKLSMNVAPMKHRDLLLDTCDPPRARTNRQGLERGREVKNTETETKQNEKKKRGPYVCVCVLLRAISKTCLATSERSGGIPGATVACGAIVGSPGCPSGDRCAHGPGTVLCGVLSAELGQAQLLLQEHDVCSTTLCTTEAPLTTLRPRIQHGASSVHWVSTWIKLGRLVLSSLNLNFVRFQLNV